MMQIGLSHNQPTNCQCGNFVNFLLLQLHAPERSPGLLAWDFIVYHVNQYTWCRTRFSIRKLHAVREKVIYIIRLLPVHLDLFRLRKTGNADVEYHIAVRESAILYGKTLCVLNQSPEWTAREYRKKFQIIYRDLKFAIVRWKVESTARRVLWARISAFPFQRHEKWQNLYGLVYVLWVECPISFSTNCSKRPFTPNA